MPTVRLRLSDYKSSKSGKQKIYMDVSISRNERYRVSTDINVLEEKWDEKFQKVKGKTKEATDINLILGKKLAAANEILVRYRLMNEELTRAKFEKEFENPYIYSDFIEYMKTNIDSRIGINTEGTTKQHRSALSKLSTYAGGYLKFSEITVDFINSFYKWLGVNLKNSKTTKNNTIRRIKTHWNSACTRLIAPPSVNPFIELPKGENKTTPTYLTVEELNVLEDAYLRKHLPYKYQRVLRLFLFSCYTGQRYSDVSRIRFEEISNHKWYNIAKKTKNINNKTIIIPLIKKAQDLINEVKDLRVYGQIFDAISEQRMNKYLKEIMKHVGIEKRVTTHVGRHTFATLYYESTNDLATLQKILGHHSITHTMIYAHVSEEKKEKSIRIFENYI